MSCCVDWNCEGEEEGAEWKDEQMVLQPPHDQIKTCIDYISVDQFTDLNLTALANLFIHVFVSAEAATS